MRHTIQRMTLLLIASSCAFAGAAAYAQDYPVKPVRIIVPLAPGGGTDVLGRVIAQKLTGKLGQPIIVENRTGAAGNIGAEFVFKAPGDGYTLLFTQPGPLAVNKALYGKIPFDPEQFVPIALVSLQDIMLAVNPKVPATTLQELVAYLKANPGKLNYGSSGAGSAPHLAAELFKSMTGTDIVHVPFKGSAESLNATIAGTVDLTFFAFSSALPSVKAGKLRGLAVGGAQRNAALPNAPSVSEVLPGYLATSWTALVASPGTPPAVAQKLSQAIAEIVRMPDVRQRMLDAGDATFEASPDQMEKFIKQESLRWGSLIKSAGITAQ